MRTARLKDFVEINPPVRLSKAVEYPFVPMDAITPGRRYVEAPGVRAAGGGTKFCGGDTLFARITPCLENGKIAQFKASETQVAFGSTEYWVFRARKNVSDPAYVFYLALSEIIRGPAEKSMSGASGRQRADIASVEDLEVPAPDLRTQSRIASTLSAYDDLIENNTRRIAILEEMARRVFEEWFVRFRFPGHDQVKMVESGLGLIPEGWKVVAASDAMIINPKVRLPKEGLKPFVPMGSLSENSMLISDTEEREGNSGSKFQNGDTLFARISPCLENGKTGFVQFLPNGDAVAFGSTEFIVLRSRTLCPEYVYALARSDEFRGNAIKSMSGATGRQRVKEACFDSFLLAQPDTETLQRYREIVQPLFAMIRKLAMKNANLRTTRDLLLPKLISGVLVLDPEEAAETVLTLKVERELSSSEIREVVSALESSLNLYTLEERINAPEGGYIGFLTKEEVKENIQLAAECVRKEAGITIFVLSSLMANVSQGVLGNLVTDLVKSGFAHDTSTVQVANPRLSEGKVKYQSDGKTVCGQLRQENLKSVLETLKGSGAILECSESGYTIRLGGGA